MRLLMNTLVALMLAGILAGVIFFNRVQEAQASDTRGTVDAIRQIQQQLTLQVALERVEMTDAGWPRTVDTAWFPLELTDNGLLSPGHPWMEVAGPAQRHRLHPISITADDRSIASFWYNPYQGIVRARVPSGMTDAETLRLYNQVNKCGLTSLVPEFAE